jgi:hypothetical protein
MLAPPLDVIPVKGVRKRDPHERCSNPVSCVDETVKGGTPECRPTEFGDRCRDRDRWSLTSYWLGALDRIVISVPLGSSRLSTPEHKLSRLPQPHQ